MLECLVRLGRAAVSRLFEEVGNGYVGPRAEKDGVAMHFVEHRKRTLHGLFGAVSYQRAYYASGTGEGWAPLDEQLGDRAPAYAGVPVLSILIHWQRGVPGELKAVSRDLPPRRC